MKQLFIKKEGNPVLLLFFAGWGSDENLFGSPVPEGCDYLLCFDYKNMDFDYSLLDGYQEIRVLAWSMGCMGGLPDIDRKRLSLWDEACLLYTSPSPRDS
mgnify:CR=1 FL=1